MKLSLIQKVYLGFGLALALLLSVAVIAVRSQREFVASDQMVRHTYEVIDEVEDIPALVATTESFRNSFILTRDERFLTTYEAAVSQLAPKLQNVRRLTADNPRQQRRLDQLEPIIGHRLAQLSDSIASRRQGRDDAERQAAVTLEGASYTETISKMIAAVASEERTLLSERSARSAAVALTTEIFLILAGAMGIVTVLLAGMMVRRDLIERQRSEESTRKSQTQFRRLFEASPDVVLLVQADGGIAKVNEQAAALFGYKADEVTGQSVDVLLPERFRAAHVHLRAGYAAAPTVRPMGRDRELFALRRDGTEFPTEISLSPVETEDGLMTLCVVRDITERKRMESERQAIFEIIQGVSTSANLDALLQLIHQTIQKVLYAENCFVALYEENTAMLTMQFFVDQRDPAPAPQKVGRGRTGYVFRTGWPMLMTNEVFETLLEHGEIESIGTPPAAWLGVPLNSPSKTIGVLVVQHYEDDKAYSERDVKFLSSVGGQVAMAIERKRAETALRESEERYREIFEMDLTGSCVSSVDGRVLASNPAFARIFGFSSVEEALASPAQSFYKTSDAREELIDLVRQERKIENRETELVRRDGSSIFVVQNLQGVFDEGGELLEMHSHFLDITERKQAESALRSSQLQLQQSQKLEAVGQLAGGIAHDFNNLLTAINGYSALALKRLDDASPVRSYIEEVKKAGDRAANLTRQLLAFSRKQILEPKVLDLNEVVGDMSKMLRRMIGEDVELATHLASELGRVKADPGQIEQIIMNLVVNARDAMPSGGKLTIETTNVFLDDEYAREHLPTEPGQYVMLAISDAGMGMDAETQARIFEPFFTTKELGKGTGLGLSTVYGIVKQSDGFVWVYSEPGHGTTFKIYLPQVDAEETTEAKPVDEAAQHGSETILLVEDDDVVRKLAQEILEAAGYDVLVADQGEEAIRLVVEHSQEIHLLLSDVVMPGASGKEIADRLIPLRPEMKVLFMSGYTDEAIVHHGVLDSGVKFIQKPFSPAALVRKIREVLDVEQVTSE